MLDASKASRSENWLGTGVVEDELSTLDFLQRVVTISTKPSKSLKSAILSGKGFVTSKQFKGTQSRYLE